MKNRITLKLSLIMIVSFGCHNLEVNTTDPQASSDMNTSKQSGLFIQEYKLFQASNTNIKVKDAWIEYSWRNKLEGSKVVKLKTGGVQLNFNITGLPGAFNTSNYLNTWQMKGRADGFVGRSNGLYF